MTQDFGIIIKEFESRISNLEEENIILKTENNALKSENATLKERLGLNSSNSSLPSSRDLYKIAKVKKNSGRKIGAQPGHKGHHRELMKADEIINIELPQSCECGGDISLSKKPYIHQKIDLSKIKPHVVEYHLAHGRCKNCGKRKTASLLKNLAQGYVRAKGKSGY